MNQSQTLDHLNPPMWTRKNLTMLQEVKIRKRPRVIIANQRVRTIWWWRKVDLWDKI
jgi:hypothetical protein